MRLQPVGRNLIVKFKKIDQDDKSPGGLILPGKKSNDDPVDALVLAVGHQCEFPIKENSLVLISPYSGVPIKGGTEEEPHRLIVEKDVLAIIND